LSLPSGRAPRGSNDPAAAGLNPERHAGSLARQGLSVVSIRGDLHTPSNIDLLAEIAREC
jgi:hypothetical protein